MGYWKVCIDFFMHYVLFMYQDVMFGEVGCISFGVVIGNFMCMFG
jgi:hypothetical protein